MKKHEPTPKTYEPPRIVHKGQLKQFAGSPLALPDEDSILGLPTR